MRAGWGFLALGATGCDSNDRFEHEKDFLRGPLREQHAKFMTLAPERQVQIYLAAQSREAPDVSFCHEMAESSGPAAVPAIVRALGVEQEEYAKLDLLRALRCVNDLHPDSCDARVLELARSTVASVQNDVWKREAQSILSGLRCTGG